MVWIDGNLQLNEQVIFFTLFLGLFPDLGTPDIPRSTPCPEIGHELHLITARLHNLHSHSTCSGTTKIPP